jgi:hypothetical protein
MDSLSRFLITILMAPAGPAEERERMCIVVRRPYAHLERELRRTFENHRDVTVVVDRRHRERRAPEHSRSDDRRRGDRRRSAEHIVEVHLLG